MKCAVSIKGATGARALPTLRRNGRLRTVLTFPGQTRFQVICPAGNTDETPTYSAPMRARAQLSGLPEGVPEVLPPPIPSHIPVAPGEVPILTPASAIPEYVFQNQDPRMYMAQTPSGQQAYFIPAPPPYPVQQYRQPETNAGGLPWFIWVGLGIIGIKALEKAMKQMMNAMQTNGQSPFGAGAPPFPGAAPGGFPGASPYGAAAGNPFAGYKPPSATVDTTVASPASSAAKQSNDALDPNKGTKFTSRLASEGREGDKKLDVVEAVVKEPSSSSSSRSSAPKAASFFQDVNVEAGKPTSSNGTSNGAASSSNGASTSNATGNVEEATVVTSMMEKMLRNPEMQKMLYPYLPEPMRNPTSIEWMLSNPEVKKQMETMLQQQGFNMPPQMLEMMKNMDLSEDKVNKQFADLGLKPDEVIQKVMASPELAAGFASPKVQQAIIDISQNPMNIMKYQGDPEVMRVLEKVNEIFAPQMAGQPGMPGMPGGMGMGMGMPPGGMGMGMPPRQ